MCRKVFKFFYSSIKKAAAGRPVHNAVYTDRSDLAFNHHNDSDYCADHKNCTQLYERIDAAITARGTLFQLFHGLCSPTPES